MTDSATPKPITRKRPIRYPRQVVIMSTEDTYRAIEAQAIEETERTGENVSKSVIARRWLEAGRAVSDAAEAAAAAR